MMSIMIIRVIVLIRGGTRKRWKRRHAVSYFLCNGLNELKLIFGVQMD